MAGCGASAPPVELQPTSSSEGTVNFRVETIHYMPPGGKSAEHYTFSAANAPTSPWQMIDASGNSVSVDISIKSPPAVPGVRMVINTMAYSDVTSGLFDIFEVVLGIPATLDTFPEGHADRLTLDYTQSPTYAFLNGTQLLALAESAPNAQALLQAFAGIGEDVPVNTINAFITAENARDILLLDPNFVALSPGGQLALRNPDELSQWVEANTDRFQPISLDGRKSPSGPPFDNTLQVVPGPRPGNGPGCKPIFYGYEPSNLTAASYGTGAQLDRAVSISVPGFDTTFEEEYQRTTTDTAGSFTLQMGSPCVTGMADVYYDAAFGTYLYVSHDIQFVLEPPGNPEWYSACTGSLGSFNGTTCSADTDCASQVCASGVCAPPTCSPNCPIGAACGIEGPGGDCGANACTYGVCTAD
jgi:hypothetical protein